MTKKRRLWLCMLLAGAGTAGALLTISEYLREKEFSDFFWFGYCLLCGGGTIGTAVFAAAVLLILSLRYPRAARPLAAAADLLTAAALLAVPPIFWIQIWWDRTVPTTPTPVSAAHRTAFVGCSALVLLFLLLAVCALRKKPAPANAVCALIGIGALIPIETLLHAADIDAAPLLMGPAASMHGLLLGALWVRYGSRRALPDALLWSALAALLLRTVVPLGSEYPLPYPSSAALPAQATAWLTAAGILTVLIGRYCAGRGGHAVRAAGYGVTAAGLLAYAVGALSVLPTIEGTVRAAGLCCLAAAAIGQAVCAAKGRPMRGTYRLVLCAVFLLAMLPWGVSILEGKRIFVQRLHTAVNIVSASLAIPLVLLAAGIVCESKENE